MNPVTNFFTLDQVLQCNGQSDGCGDLDRNTSHPFWAIVDSYVLDLTNFLEHHPSGAAKIIKRREKNVDISSNFLDHFGHTVRTFRNACQQYEAQLTKANGEHVVVTFEFKERPGISVSIVGKVLSDG